MSTETDSSTKNVTVPSIGTKVRAVRNVSIVDDNEKIQEQMCSQGVYEVVEYSQDDETITLHKIGGRDGGTKKITLPTKIAEMDLDVLPVDVQRVDSYEEFMNNGSTLKSSSEVYSQG